MKWGEPSFRKVPRRLIGLNANLGEREMSSLASLEQYVKVPDLLDRVEGDRELLRELFRLFLEDLPGDRNGLLEAIEGGDHRGAIGAAHKLKGMLANLSAVHMAALASEIESAARAEDTEKTKRLLSDLDVEIEGFSAALNAFLTSVQT